MLALLLFTAVFSDTNAYKRHSHHDIEEISPFKAVSETTYKVLKGEKNDLPETLILTFRFDEHDFSLNLTQSRIADPTFFDKDFLIHYRVHPKYSRVDDYPIDHGAIMFVDGKMSETFEGAVSYDGASFSFKPASRNADFKDSTTLVIGTTRRFMKSRRRLDTIDEFSECWPGHGTMTKEVEIGYIVDPDFVAVALADRAGDSCNGLTDAECTRQKVTAAVTKINDETNTIYRAQFGVILKQMPIIDQQGIFDEQMTQEFPLGCETWNKQQDNILQYLQTLAAWRTAVKRQTYGVWKILTNCFPPPGTIGIAYLGTLCREYGTGVTTWTDDRTWLTNAHEVGHIFGAEHSFEEGQGRTGGIMDYGDGTLNGVFQFNIKYRKNDVCGTISETMAAPRVPNCWKTLSLDGENRYDWEKRTDANGGTYGECLPARGVDRYKTTQYFCQENGVTEVADALCDLGNKPIFDFASHQFTQSGCPAITTQVCGDGNLEPGEECEKDLSDNPDCCENCQWVGTAECQAKAHQIDAAFVKDNRLYLFRGNQVYKYGGDAESVFDHGSPLDGFPKLIIEAFPGLNTAAAYSLGLDAALSIPGSKLVYLFKGLDFVVYDLETHSIKTGSVQSQVAQEFANCGKVDAAVGFAGEMYLFCGSLLNLVPYGNPYISHNVAHDLDLNFPETIMTTMDAAAHDPSTSETIFYNGGHETRWVARSSTGAARKMNVLGENGANEAKVCPNFCARCDRNNAQICQECEAAYVLSAVGMCIADNVFALLDFNTNSENDAKHIKGGKAKMSELAQAGKYKSGLQSALPLDDEQGLYFDGTDQVEMNSLDVEWTEGLKITAYFKPLNVQFETQKFLSLTDGNEEKLAISFGAKQPCAPPDGCNCIQSGNIAPQCQYIASSQQAFCVVNPDCPSAFQTQDGLDVAQCAGISCSNYAPGSIQSTEFELQIKLPESSFNCFVEVPLQADQWNALTFEFSDTVFTTGVNGLTHKQAFENMGGDINNHFKIKEWSLGAQTGGILGTVDHFQIAIGEASHLTVAAESDGDSGNGGAVAAGILIPLLFIGLCVLGYYYRDDINKWISDDSGKTSGRGKADIAMSTPAMGYVVAKEQPEGQATGLAPAQRRTGRLSFDISKSKNVEWYFANESGLTEGPMPRSKLVDQINKSVSADTYVWNPDMDEWKAAGETEFATYFAQKSPVPPIPPVSATAPIVSATADVMWNYVGEDNENVGPIREKDLLKLKLPGDTYVWNGTTVSDWTFISDTYLSKH